jgi:hypothetical protein
MAHPSAARTRTLTDRMNDAGVYKAPDEFDEDGEVLVHYQESKDTWNRRRA